MADGQSPWRDAHTRQQPATRDCKLLQERLDDDQITVLRAMVQAADTQGAVGFVVVRSVARGDHNDERAAV